MAKIYKDADNQYVAATIIYSTSFFGTPLAYHDIEMTRTMTSEELKSAFYNGAVVRDAERFESVDEGFKPVAFYDKVDDLRAAQIVIWKDDDGSLSPSYISAVDPEE